MTDKKLRTDLEKLRQEVNTLATGNLSTQEKLNALINDIENKFEMPDEKTNDEGLIDRIKETINHFEAEHPRATGILNDIMITLSNIGI